MKQLQPGDLKNLALGTAFLGSGGGGDSFQASEMVRYQMERYGPARLISLDALGKDDLVLPLSLMGAPLVTIERIPNGNECLTIVQEVEKAFGRKVTALAAAEIGGANAFTPLMIASRLNLPVVDGDMIGRAFPALQMSSCYLAGLKATPAFQADCLGRSYFYQEGTAEELEERAREVTVKVGSSSAIGFYLMTGEEAKIGLIEGSFSKALSIGNDLKKVLGEGILIDIDQAIRGGFLEGTLTLHTTNGPLKIFYQNEYLLAELGGERIAATPDMLVLIDKRSGAPLPSEGLRFGLELQLVVIAAPDIWKTEKGMALVGPQAFGY
jgi:DUF917 family protein